MEDARKRKLLFMIYDWSRFIAIVLVMCILIVMFCRPSFVVGISMMNTLEDGDFVVMEKFSYISRIPRRGDIVIIKSKNEPDKILVKRIIAVPGDAIKVEDGFVYLNGEQLEETYIKDGITNGSADLIVPADNFFVMGDNRLHSNDSRFNVGLVERNEIMGRVYFRVFPFNKLGGI